MFGLGPTEIIIILVVALIFVGPAKLPEIARSIGRGLRDLRRVSDDFQREIQRTTWEQEELDRRNAPPRPGTARSAADASVVVPRAADGAVAQGAEPIQSSELPTSGQDVSSDDATAHRAESPPSLEKTPPV
jgi:Tat protein translocase TatB subunit